MSNQLELSKNLPGRPTNKKTKSRVSEKKKTSATVMISLILIVVLATGSIILLKSGIAAGAHALTNSYRVSYNSEKNASYQKLYQAAFDRAEKNYHVSNKVFISIGDVEETQKLEVLTANDIEFITEDRDENTGNVTAWLEVEGQGTFVIDLRAAEYVIDNEHRCKIHPHLYTNILVLYCLMGQSM